MCGEECEMRILKSRIKNLKSIPSICRFVGIALTPTLSQRRGSNMVFFHQKCYIKNIKKLNSNKNTHD